MDPKRASYLSQDLLRIVLPRLSPRELARAKPVARCWRAVGRELNGLSLARVEQAGGGSVPLGCRVSENAARAAVHPLVLRGACGGSLCAYVGWRLAWYGLRDARAFLPSAGAGGGGNGDDEPQQQQQQQQQQQREEMLLFASRERRGTYSDGAPSYDARLCSLALGEPPRMIVSPPADPWPVLAVRSMAVSPRGALVAWETMQGSLRIGPDELHVSRASDGGPPIFCVRAICSHTQGFWSPDGAFLAVLATPHKWHWCVPGPGALYVVDVASALGAAAAGPAGAQPPDAAARPSTLRVAFLCCVESDAEVAWAPSGRLFVFGRKHGLAWWDPFSEASAWEQLAPNALSVALTVRLPGPTVRVSVAPAGDVPMFQLDADGGARLAQTSAMPPSFVQRHGRVLGAQAFFDAAARSDKLLLQLTSLVRNEYACRLLVVDAARPREALEAYGEWQEAVTVPAAIGGGVGDEDVGGGRIDMLHVLDDEPWPEDPAAPADPSALFFAALGRSLNHGSCTVAVRPQGGLMAICNERVLYLRPAAGGVDAPPPTLRIFPPPSDSLLGREPGPGLEENFLRAVCRVSGLVDPDAESWGFAKLDWRVRWSPCGSRLLLCVDDYDDWDEPSEDEDAFYQDIADGPFQTLVMVMELPPGYAGGGLPDRLRLLVDREWRRPTMSRHPMQGVPECGTLAEPGLPMWRADGSAFAFPATPGPTLRPTKYAGPGAALVVRLPDPSTAEGGRDFWSGRDWEQGPADDSGRGGDKNDGGSKGEGGDVHGGGDADEPMPDAEPWLLYDVAAPLSAAEARSCGRAPQATVPMLVVRAPAPQQATADGAVHHSLAWVPRPPGG